MGSATPILTIGSFQVTPFSLAILAGALAGVLLVWKHKEVRPLLAPAVLGALLAGHILWVLFCPPAFVQEDGKGAMILRIWEGGYTLYGALAGGALAAAIGARILKLRPLDVLDKLAPGACAALIFARIGEWLAGQGYGEWMDEENPLFFPITYFSWLDEDYGVWRYAVWFWEAAAAAAILVFLLIRAKKALEGQQTALFLTALGCSQILLEQFRKDSFVRVNTFVRFSQLAAMATLIAVLVILIIRRKPGRKIAALSSAVLLFAALSVVFAEFAFDKPQYYKLLYGSMILTAVSGTVLMLAARKARGLIAAVPFAAAAVGLTVIHMAGQWEEAAPLLYAMIAVSTLAMGIGIYLAGSRKEA